MCVHFRGLSTTKLSSSSIPLTGDQQADADILAFVRARQKLLNRTGKTHKARNNTHTKPTHNVAFNVALWRHNALQHFRLQQSLQHMTINVLRAGYIAHPLCFILGTAITVDYKLKMISDHFRK